MTTDDRDDRLDRLTERLAGATQAQREKEEGPKPDAKLGLGMRIVTELIAGVCGGAFIGWLLDRWLGTSPLLLILLLIGGSAAALWNVVKIASRA